MLTAPRKHRRLHVCSSWKAFLSATGNADAERQRGGSNSSKKLFQAEKEKTLEQEMLQEGRLFCLFVFNGQTKKAGICKSVHKWKKAAGKGADCRHLHTAAP